MPRLKCWKKTTDRNKWLNIKERNKFVEMYPWNKSHIVQTEKGFNAEGLIAVSSSKVIALKRAMDYMKDHDSC